MEEREEGGGGGGSSNSWKPPPLKVTGRGGGGETASPGALIRDNACRLDRGRPFLDLAAHETGEIAR